MPRELTVDTKAYVRQPAWRRYQQAVAELAPDLAWALTGRPPREIQIEAPIEGLQGHRHRVDVLVDLGTSMICFECKHFAQPLSKDTLSPRLTDFVDICLAHPSKSWTLCFVSASHIPPAARTAVAVWQSANASMDNLERLTLADSCHFCYFRPTWARAGLIVDEDESVREVVVQGVPPAPDLHEILMNPDLAVGLRARAGLWLAQQDLDRLGSDQQAAYSLRHCLLHLDMLHEDRFLLKYWISHGFGRESFVVDELTAKYRLARRYHGNLPRAGFRALGAMVRLFGSSSVDEQLSIETFAGPALIRMGDHEGGHALLSTVSSLASPSSALHGPYHRFLAHARRGQLSGDREFGAEELAHAETLRAELPTWNRALADTLLSSIRSDPATLYGIDVPLWPEPGG